MKRRGEKKGTGGHDGAGWEVRGGKRGCWRRREGRSGRKGEERDDDNEGRMRWKRRKMKDEQGRWKAIDGA